MLTIILFFNKVAAERFIYVNLKICPKGSTIPPPCRSGSGSPLVPGAKDQTSPFLLPGALDRRAAASCTARMSEARHRARFRGSESPPPQRTPTRTSGLRGLGTYLAPFGSRHPNRRLCCAGFLFIKKNHTVIAVRFFKTDFVITADN